MKKSTVYSILTWVFAAITVLVALYVIATNMPAGKIIVLLPGAASLIFSNLSVRARSEKK